MRDPIMIDSEGQPPAWLHAKGRAERDIAEMLGVAKGVLFDGVVNDDESLGLLNWAEDHPDVVSVWPGRVIHQRLRDIFADGHVSEDERDDLRRTLQLLVGGDAGMIGGHTTASELPWDEPLPLVEVPGRVFVLTGQFAVGCRHACEESVRAVGGWPEKDVTQRTDYLVIGTFGSRDWKQTSYGRKIEKAIKYRTKRGRPAIIPEDHWAASLR